MCLSLLGGALPKGARAIKGSLASFATEIKFKPHYNAGFQVEYAFTIVGHLLRLINNLLHAALYIVAAAPLLFLSPCDIPFLPVIIGEHLLAAAISCVTMAVQPVTFSIRTLFSIVFGYAETSENNPEANWDWCLTEEDEKENLSRCFDFMIPSALFA